MYKTISSILLAAFGFAFTATQAFALDKVRLINSTKVVFEMEHAYAALENGVFKKNGLDVSIIHGSGGAATLQTIITGSQDVAFGCGVLAVISAYSKGAPVRILGSTKRGTGDIYWYVKSNSKIKSLKDLNGGKDLVYSRPGSSTHLTTLFLKDALNLSAKLVSVGGPSGSRTQVMSGQVDTGWSVYPLNAGLINSGKIRVIGSGKQAVGLNGVTIRVVVANSNWLNKNRDAAKRLMRAMYIGQAIAYSSEKQQRAYAKRWKLKYENINEMDKYVPLSEGSYKPIGKINQLNEMALKFKRTKKLLTQAQLKELVHIDGYKP